MTNILSVQGNIAAKTQAPLEGQMIDDPLPVRFTCLGVFAVVEKIFPQARVFLLEPFHAKVARVFGFQKQSELTQGLVIGQNPGGKGDYKAVLPFRWQGQVNLFPIYSAAGLIPVMLVEIVV